MTEVALTKATPETPRPWATAPVDVWESKDEYLLALDLPGVQKDAVKLTFEDGTLFVNATRGSNGDAIDVRRSFKLNGSVDLDGMKAELSDGVLSVHLPKAEERKPRQIPIQVS